MLSIPGISGTVRRVRGVELVSLCLHRFAGPQNAFGGHDLDRLDESLTWLRRSGFVFGELEDTIRGLLRGRMPGVPTVLVTIDDGYADLVHAIPVFRKHACPVSVFLATKFLDDRTPLWWDQVHLLLATAAGHARVHNVAGISWSAHWLNDAERTTRGSELIELIKRRPEPARREVIAALAAELGQPVPTGDIKGYQALSWDEARRLEQESVRFGPHTHSHPILASTGNDEARREIETSLKRLRDELERPLTIFAYPDGTPWSFSDRDIVLLRNAGVEAALTMDARWQWPNGSPLDAYRIGRMSYQERLSALQGSVLRLRRGAISPLFPF